MGDLIEYSKKEEIANAITHGLGVAFGIFALVFLIITHYKTTDIYGLVSYIVYGASLIILYLSSTLYHSIPIKRAKIHLRKLDHASIFILIAGTYTPISMVALRGKLGWTILITIWSIALLGIIFKVFFINKLKIILALRIFTVENDRCVVNYEVSWTCFTGIPEFQQFSFHFPFPVM